MSDHKTAIILLAHGTPDELADIPKYLSNVVSGRPMPDAVIEEITHRYGLIGKSPLTALTLEQARLLSDALNLPVYTGMRNWKPYIVDTVKQMKADGITRAVAICLAPQNSRTSVGLYKRAVFAEAAGAIEIDFVEGWADHPLLADAFAERLRSAIETAQAENGERPVVLFTAHSVPCRTIQTPAPDANAAETVTKRPALAPDPYPVEAKRTAAAVAARCGLSESEWFFAFQSQGMAGGPWIGPTVESTLDALHAQGVKNVVLHTIGFLCDHVEILYDIDIAFKEHAENLGMRLTRPASLNDSPLLTAALADLAHGGLRRLDGTRHGHAELTAAAPVPA